LCAIVESGWASGASQKTIRAREERASAVAAGTAKPKPTSTSTGGEDNTPALAVRPIGLEHVDVVLSGRCKGADGSASPRAVET